MYVGLYARAVCLLSWGSSMHGTERWGPPTHGTEGGGWDYLETVDGTCTYLAGPHQLDAFDNDDDDGNRPHDGRCNVSIHWGTDASIWKGLHSIL